MIFTKTWSGDLHTEEIRITPRTQGIYNFLLDDENVVVEVGHKDGSTTAYKLRHLWDENDMI